jgi:hypothetical protein
MHQYSSIRAPNYHCHGTVVESAQVLQCKYAAASSKVYTGVSISPRQVFLHLLCRKWAPDHLPALQQLNMSSSAVVYELIRVRVVVPSQQRPATAHIRKGVYAEA